MVILLAIKCSKDAPKRTLTNKLFHPGAGVLFQFLYHLDKLFTQAD